MDTKMIEQFHEMDITMLSSIEGGKNNWQTNVLEGGGAAFGGWGLGTAICAKLDILAFGAHPDDVELGAAGTIAKEISLGRSVGIIDLTQGELGTRGSAKIRHQEATKAKFMRFF